MEANTSAGVIVRKCRCSSTWCPVCGKEKIIRFLTERIKDFDWRSTRELIVSIDPKKILTPWEAFKLIVEKRRQLIDDLQRKEGIIILDWFGVLEWYRSGYPHLHILIMVDKPGKQGMIGGKRLYRNWKHGIIKENYIRNQKHWDNKIGYAAKVGYFCKGKEYQTRLPDWASCANNIIRRVYGRPIKEKYKREIQFGGVPFRRITGERNERRTYDLILKSCGQKTKVSVWVNGLVHSEEVIDAPFKEILKFLGPCEYRTGIGFIKKLHKNELFDFIESYDMNDVLIPVESMMMRWERKRGEYYV